MKCDTDLGFPSSVLLHDVNGIPQRVLLQNTLYVPSYKQDIFSVQAATEKSASVSFTPKSVESTAADGTVFNIAKQVKLCFLNNVSPLKRSTQTVEEWHRILGLYNILKLEGVVNSMNIVG